MAILRVRDENGNLHDVLVLKGDPGKDYVLTEADKQEIAAMVNVDVSCPVTSVNGHTGEVQLSAEDVGALSEKIVIPTKISELDNDKGYITNYVELDPSVPGWAKASSKPSYSKSEVGLGNVDNVKQYSANNPPPYPVTSVNGQTGAVTITTLPTVTTNDNGKVLMVVGGTWKLVDLNLSVDSNGVLSV